MYWDFVRYSSASWSLLPLWNPESLETQRRDLDGIQSGIMWSLFLYFFYQKFSTPSKRVCFPHWTPRVKVPATILRLHWSWWCLIVASACLLCFLPARAAMRLTVKEHLHLGRNLTPPLIFRPISQADSALKISSWGWSMTGPKHC